jgi:hypothetical protein
MLLCLSSRWPDMTEVQPCTGDLVHREFCLVVANLYGSSWKAIIDLQSSILRGLMHEMRHPRHNLLGRHRVL